MNRELRCRIMVPAESGYVELSDISDEKQREFADKCVQRMGQVLNDSFSRNTEMYRKVAK